MFITGKALPRRTVLRGLGATVALPFLEAMVPAGALARLRRDRSLHGFGAPSSSTAESGSSTRLVCIEIVHGAAGSSPFGGQRNLWAPAENRPRLRPRGHEPELARAVPRLPHHRQQHRCRQRQCDRSPRDRWRSLPIDRRVSHPVLPQANRRRRHRSRHVARSALRPADRAADADSIHADVHRRRGSVRRLPVRLFVRVRRLAELGVAEQAAADGQGSARHLRRVARSVRCRGTPKPSGWNGAGRTRASSIGSQTPRRGSNERSDRPIGLDLTTTSRTSGRSNAAFRTSNHATAPARYGSSRRRRAGIPDSFAEHVQLMFDLQLLAFRADYTRVFTLKLSRDGSNRAYPESGYNGPFHNTSHHSNREERILDFAEINAYHVSMLPVLPREAEVDARRLTALFSTAPWYYTVRLWAIPTCTITNGSLSSSSRRQARRCQGARM